MRRQERRARGIRPRIARRGIERSDGHGRHRWVVERSHVWLSRARRLLDVLRLGGVATGQDIAVAGFDGLSQSARPMDDLTTVEQQVVAMIGSGLDLLQARIRDKGLPDETISQHGLSGSKGR